MDLMTITWVVVAFVDVQILAIGFLIVQAVYLRRQEKQKGRLKAHAAAARDSVRALAEKTLSSTMRPG